MIEALGVPHTEVDLILVNGNPSTSIMTNANKRGQGLISDYMITKQALTPFSNKVFIRQPEGA